MKKKPPEMHVGRVEQEIMMSKVFTIIACFLSYICILLMHEKVRTFVLSCPTMLLIYGFCVKDEWRQTTNQSVVSIRSSAC